MAAEGAESEWAIVEAPSLEALLSKSKDLCAEGEFAEAVSTAEEALALAKDGGKTRSELSALCTLAQVQCRRGDASAALETAKQMRTLCHATKGEEEAEAQALLEIASAHLSQHEGKPAARAANAAVKLCAKANDGKGACADVRVVALVTVAEANLVMLVDYHSAVFRDARLQLEMDSAANRAFDCVTEAVQLCDVAIENAPDSDDEEQAGQHIVPYDDQRQVVKDLRVRAQAYYWYARVFLVFADKEQEALEAAAKARFMYGKVQDSNQEAEALLVIAQAYHKIDPQTQWASTALHDALEIFQRKKNLEAKERTFLLFQELGISLRVAGGFAAGGFAPESPQPAPQPTKAVESVVEKPKGLDPTEVMQAVQEMAKAAIGLDEELYLDSPLMDSGMDSLTAVSFRNGLQQNLGVKLPSSLMFDYPTMKEVGNRIVELSLEED